MGSIAETAGTVRVRDCPEVRSILKALDGLAERRATMRQRRPQPASWEGEPPGEPWGRLNDEGWRMGRQG